MLHLADLSNASPVLWLLLKPSSLVPRLLNTHHVLHNPQQNLLRARGDHRSRSLPLRLDPVHGRDRSFFPLHSEGGEEDAQGQSRSPAEFGIQRFVATLSTIGAF